MMETVITERLGERQEHQQVQIAFKDLEDSTIHSDGCELVVTFTGTSAEAKCFLKKLAVQIEKAAQ